MKELLSKYQAKGNFSFTPYELLESKCNAPSDRSGVYLVFEVVGDREKLIYIGSSGQRNKDGGIKTRKSGIGGMKDRIVNGYHPKFERRPRKKTWPENMILGGISKIKVYWWVTYDDQHSDFPTDVERMLSEKYKNEFQRMPLWHK